MKRTAVGACLMAVLLLSGCGVGKAPEAVDNTTLVIHEKGNVTFYLVDDFDKDYYSVSELTNMAVEEANTYNEAAKASGEEAPVTVKNVEPVATDAARVVVTYEYDSCESFADHNESVLFYGTVAEAVKQGYDLNAAMRKTKDGSLMSKEELLKDADKHLILVEAQAIIYPPGKVQAVTDNVSREGNGPVNALEAEGMVAVLLK